MSNRYISLLRDPFWGFSGDFAVETVFAFTGYRFRQYISINSIYQMINEHHDPENHFLVSVQQLRDKKQYSWDNGRLLGIAHRHPPNMPTPSNDDFEGLHISLLGAVWCEGEVTWYDNKGVLDVKYLFAVEND